MFWNKRPGCPEGAECAWRFQDKLFETKELRDAEARRHKRNLDRIDFVAKIAPRIKDLLMYTTDLTGQTPMILSVRVSEVLFDNPRILKSIVEGGDI